MTPHVITAIATVVLAVAALAFSAFAIGAGAEGATPPGKVPGSGDLEVLGAEAALRPLRPELALGDHATPFAMAHQGADRGARIPPPPPPPIDEAPLPVLPLAPER